MPIDLTDDEREAAIDAMIDADRGHSNPNWREDPLWVWEGVREDMGEVLDALLAAGWRPEPQPAAETEDDDAHLLIAGSSIEEVQAYLYGFGNDWAKRALEIIHELSAAIDAFEGKVGPGMWRFWADKARKMAAEQKDAISAAEARGRREGIEAAVAWHERAEAQCLVDMKDSPTAYFQDLWQAHASAHRSAAAALRALSSIPPQEADPT